LMRKCMQQHRICNQITRTCTWLAVNAATSTCRATTPLPAFALARRRQGWLDRGHHVPDPGRAPHHRDGPRAAGEHCGTAHPSRLGQPCSAAAIEGFSAVDQAPASLCPCLAHAAHAPFLPRPAPQLVEFETQQLTALTAPTAPAAAK
jgi:hypothetical protein